MYHMRAKRFLNLVSDHLHTLPLVVLYLTDGCNSRCITCDIWRSPRRNMSLALVEDIAGACRELDVRWLLLSGGEAMQHPQWPQIARRFRDEGVYVMLLTNGLLLKKQADEVLSSVDEVIVSLDGGTPETYRAIRGVDAFDLVMDGIRAVRVGGLPVITRTTVQRANYQELPQIIEAALAADVTRISFLPVDVSSVEAFGPRFQVAPSLPMASRSGEDPDRSPAAAALTPEDVRRFASILDELETTYADAFASGRIAESPGKLRRMLAYFDGVAGRERFSPPRCNAPHTSVVIEVDGTLRPCYFLPAWGRMDGHSLGEALNEKGAQALRRAYRQGLRPECERCVCPLYMGPRTLLRL